MKMKYNFKQFSVKQKIMMLLKLFFSVQTAYKRSFLKYHLIRRKYILSKSCTIFQKDKFEPAPLLNKKILDVGTGINQISDELAFRGAEILAIDSNLEILTAAKNNALHSGSPVEYKHLNFENLSEDRKFDIILFLDFLNSNNIKESLKKAKNILNKDGIIIISGSNKSLRSFVRNILIPKFLLRMMHLNIKFKDLIRVRKVKKEVKRIDFVIKDIQGINFNFYVGKWYKSRSTRVRFMMCCVRKDHPINMIEKE